MVPQEAALETVLAFSCSLEDGARCGGVKVVFARVAILRHLDVGQAYERRHIRDVFRRREVYISRFCGEVRRDVVCKATPAAPSFAPCTQTWVGWVKEEEERRTLHQSRTASRPRRGNTARPRRASSGIACPCSRRVCSSSPPSRAFYAARRTASSRPDSPPRPRPRPPLLPLRLAVRSHGSCCLLPRRRLGTRAAG